MRKPAKITLLAFILAIGAIAATSASADSCASVLCLAGMLQGQGGGSQCNGPIADYLNIQVWNKDGFDAGGTANARMNFLSQCPYDQNWLQQINNAYGTTH
ncbi:MAG: TrbM/KikA/MpfK family conjugal transfer protein [Magnetospirillum sp.]|nr:TrbM/KikA/MpfK family conjugal transfer protein [Magnetospirillum sp.]